MKFAFRFSLPTFVIFIFLSCHRVFAKLTFDKPTNKQPNMWPFDVETVPLPEGYQSPINIMTRNVKIVNMPPLNTRSYDEISKYEKVTCENNGHTIECSIKNINTTLPYIEGGPLTNRYIFSNIHWHWGKIDMAGSEHYLNGKTYAAEIHVVHFKQKYGTFEEAKNHQDGLCVFAFFATLSPFDNPDLDILFDDISNLSVCESKLDRCWFEILGFVNSMMRNNQDWITYPGALTSSPYIETVTWIIFRKKFKISPNQLNQLRKLQKADGQQNLEHRRGLFPLNKRPVLSRIALKSTKPTKLNISVTKSIELTPKLEIRL